MESWIEIYTILASGPLFFDSIIFAPHEVPKSQVQMRKLESREGCLSLRVTRPMWGGGKTRPWAHDFSSSALVFLKMMELKAMVSRLVAGSQMQMRFSWAFHVLRALRAHAY